MKVTRMNTKIELDNEEKKILGDAVELLIKISYEINDGDLYGYNSADWEEILDGLEKSAESGIIEID